jgi:hypothetical protein
LASNWDSIYRGERLSSIEDVREKEHPLDPLRHSVGCSEKGVTAGGRHGRSCCA